MHILNLNTPIYLYEPSDFAQSNLNIFRQLYLSISPRSFKHGYPLQFKSYQSFSGVPTRTSLAKANLVIHLPAILLRMPLAEANLVIHFLAILSWMSLAEANLINTLDFIYIEHDIYCNCIHQKNFKLHKCKEEGKSRTCSASLMTSPNRRSNPGRSS